MTKLNQNHHPHPPESAEQAVKRSFSDRLRNAYSFEQMRKAVDVPANMWDAFLITDGSATVIAKSAGYAAVLIERDEIAPLILSGSQSHATVNAAELEAVI